MRNDTSPHTAHTDARLRSSTALRAVLAVLALTALTLGALVAHPGSTASAAADPVRIMPLGDSITGSPGCWRAVLRNRLQNAGYTPEFVGTLGPQGCAQGSDGNNEGHGGYLATNVADQNLLPGWLSATRPDIVVMHFGTNDVWSSISPDRILAAFDTLVDQMRASNPDMKILVAQIIPMNPSGCAECAQRAVAFNARIPAWAAGRTTARSPVTAVDQWTGFNTATDTYDGVHPNSSGDDKMAARWYPALTPLLTPGTSTPTPTPTPSVPGATGCAASLRTVSSWQGGYQAEVTVRNNGTAPLSGWTVRLTVPTGEAITQVWNGTLTAGSGTASVADASWNGALAAGATTTFGFIASQPASATPATTVADCTAR
ncbi:cellulose binding domain-containing protein [Streptomyces sp. NPDC093109]|uniref:cellulose binding domain-containing protein n=1 Tax=Streptomyces sp. NPDC093109 TaxID=3154977 RepID=UPI00344D9C16